MYYCLEALHSDYIFNLLNATTTFGDNFVVMAVHMIAFPPFLMRMLNKQSKRICYGWEIPYSIFFG